MPSNDQSESRLDATISENVELGSMLVSPGYGESNSISIQHARKGTIRKRTSTKTSNETTSPDSPFTEDTITDLPPISDLKEKKLEIPLNQTSDITSNINQISGISLQVPKESRISRSVSERPGPINKNSSTTTRHSADSTIKVSHGGRRASADQYLQPKRMVTFGGAADQNEDNKPNWFYEDVPDPDAEDWGKLDGILSVLNPDTPNQVQNDVIQAENPVVRVEDVGDEISTTHTIDVSSMALHQLESSSSIPLQSFFVPKDSQQKLIDSQASDGTGYLDVEVESIISRRSSLSADPHYVGPVFRSIPAWIPIRTIYVALFFLLVTSTLNIMILVSSITQWFKMPRCSTE